MDAQKPQRHWILCLLFHYHVRNTLVGALLVTASLVIINNCWWPFVWVGAMWSLLLGIATIFPSRPFPRVVWFNLAFCCAALTCAETYLAWSSMPSVNVEQSRIKHNKTHRPTTERQVAVTTGNAAVNSSGTNETQNDDILGYAPKKHQSSTARKVVHGQTIYEVTETIDRAGLRISPPAEGATNSIVFFGGSFTYGQGVNDDETMPYVVGSRLKHEYKVYNFGFCGYGPHQMLAAIQDGLVDKVVNEQPTIGVYQAIPGHIDRAAGLSSWDQNGPRFLLNEHGEVERHGKFSDGGSLQTRKIIARLRRSFLIDKSMAFVSKQRVGYRGVELFGAIVDQARNDFQEKYPGSEFHVILWDDYHLQKDAIIADLKRRNLRVHLVGEIIPEFLVSPEPYRLSEFDHHPSAKAHKEIAGYVTDRIVR